MISFQNKTIYFFFSYIEEEKYYDYERREKMVNMPLKNIEEN